jgi:hypothetical protein
LDLPGLCPLPPPRVFVFVVLLLRLCLRHCAALSGFVSVSSLHRLASVPLFSLRWCVSLHLVFRACSALQLVSLFPCPVSLCPWHCGTEFPSLCVCVSLASVPVSLSYSRHSSRSSSRSSSSRRSRSRSSRHSSCCSRGGSSSSREIVSCVSMCDAKSNRFVSVCQNCQACSEGRGLEDVRRIQLCKVKEIASKVGIYHHSVCCINVSPLLSLC